MKWLTDFAFMSELNNLASFVDDLIQELDKTKQKISSRLNKKPFKQDEIKKILRKKEKDLLFAYYFSFPINLFLSSLIQMAQNKEYPIRDELELAKKEIFSANFVDRLERLKEVIFMIKNIYIVNLLNKNAQLINMASELIKNKLNMNKSGSISIVVKDMKQKKDDYQLQSMYNHFAINLFVYEQFISQLSSQDKRRLPVSVILLKSQQAKKVMSIKDALCKRFHTHVALKSQQIGRKDISKSLKEVKLQNESLAPMELASARKRTLDRDVKNNAKRTSAFFISKSSGERYHSNPPSCLINDSKPKYNKNNIRLPSERTSSFYIIKTDDGKHYHDPRCLNSKGEPTLFKYTAHYSSPDKKTKSDNTIRFIV